MLTKLAELERIARKLEPELTERKEITTQTTAYINQFIEALPKAPGYTTGECKELKSLKVGAEGKSLDQLLGIIGQEVDGIGINSASGVHLGYIPGGGLWTSAIADMIAAATNRYAGIFYSSPGAIIIENQMIQWLCSLVGYPATAHGNLTSGGSIANLIAVKTARDAFSINSTNVRQAVIYSTEQIHHCLYKALHMTGLYEAVHRIIPMNELYQMDTEALQTTMQRDKQEGLHPFLVMATAGTTSTGAVDPLEAIADCCAIHNAWFHVDAAYGGFFLLVDEIKEKFKGIERSDSVVMDPHKSLFLPYGSGVVLIRNAAQLLASNAHTGHPAPYMQDAHGFSLVHPIAALS